MNAEKQPARALVVDDEERNRRVLTAMLEVEGYVVLEAADGERALELARQNPPDIVLLDIMMPGLDGYQVARALKADEATRSVPIIMVTALTDRGSLVKALEAGAEEYVSKPVDRWELRVRVKNQLNVSESAIEAETMQEFVTKYAEASRNMVELRSGRSPGSYQWSLSTPWQQETHLGRCQFKDIDVRITYDVDIVTLGGPVAQDSSARASVE